MAEMPKQCAAIVVGLQKYEQQQQCDALMTLNAQLWHFVWPSAVLCGNRLFE